MLSSWLGKKDPLIIEFDSSIKKGFKQTNLFWDLSEERVFLPAAKKEAHEKNFKQVHFFYAQKIISNFDLE